MKVSVLFVCLGNICRSPMAEAVFRDKVVKIGLEEEIEIDSAGTGQWHIGEQPHEGTRNILKKNSISSDGLVARQFDVKKDSRFMYIITMDEKNMEHVKKLHEEYPDVYTGKLLDFHPGHKGKDVPDPYFTGNFEEVYSMVDQSCTYLLEWIRERENL